MNKPRHSVKDYKHLTEPNKSSVVTSILSIFRKKEGDKGANKKTYWASGKANSASTKRKGGIKTNRSNNAKEELKHEKSLPKFLSPKYYLNLLKNLVVGFFALLVGLILKTYLYVYNRLNKSLENLLRGLNNRLNFIGAVFFIFVIIIITTLSKKSATRFNFLYFN